MDTQRVAHPCSGRLQPYRGRGFLTSAATWMDLRRRAQCSKPVTEGRILCDPSCVRALSRQIHRDSLVGSRGSPSSSRSWLLPVIYLLPHLQGSLPSLPCCGADSAGALLVPPGLLLEEVSGGSPASSRSSRPCGDSSPSASALGFRCALGFRRALGFRCALGFRRALSSASLTRRRAGAAGLVSTSVLPGPQRRWPALRTRLRPAPGAGHCLGVPSELLGPGDTPSAHAGPGRGSRSLRLPPSDLVGVCWLRAVPAVRPAPCVDPSAWKRLSWLFPRLLECLSGAGAAGRPSEESPGESVACREGARPRGGPACRGHGASSLRLCPVRVFAGAVPACSLAL